MDDTKKVSLESDSEAFVENSKMSVTDQSEMLRNKYSNVSVLPATEALSANEISQDASESSGTIEPFSGESSSTLVASQTVCGTLEDEQQADDDDPTAPLIPPRHHGDFLPPVDAIDNRTSEPPQPQRPSYIQCMCCCYITTYNIHEDGQKISPYQPYTINIRNSKFILLVLIALLSIPVSSIYFGFTYKESCPMARFLPVLLIFMGVDGLIFIVVRLVTVSIRKRLCNLREPSKTIPISLTFILVVCMATEMFAIYSSKPVFDNSKDPAFCEKAFYDYAFYMNFVVLVIGIPTLLLHIPKKLFGDVRITMRFSRHYADAV